MSDLDALIGQQIAANAAREALPGRYDDVLISKLAARVQEVHEDIASWRQAHAEPEPRGDEWDLALRELGGQSKQANAAYGLRAVHAHPIVAVSDQGWPLTAPTMDLEQIVAMWSPGGPYADRWPGVVCAEGGMYALAVTGRGKEWLAKLRKVTAPTRLERLDAWLKDPIDALGVPGPISDWDAPDDYPKPPELRPMMSYPLRLVEDRPAHVPVTRAWIGGTQSREAQAAMAAARGRPPLLWEWICWSWPQGLELPTGVLADGVASVPALPAEGALLDFGGMIWRVTQWPIEPYLNPPPEWLIAAVKELA